MVLGVYTAGNGLFTKGKMGSQRGRESYVVVQAGWESLLSAGNTLCNYVHQSRSVWGMVSYDLGFFDTSWFFVVHYYDARVEMALD